MNVQNLLVGLNSVILIFLVVNVFKPFFGSYAAKKGENLATKEDIAQLTKIAEGIRAKISDKVWDRQKQWELRRDTLFETVRTLSDLNYALIELLSIHSRPIPEPEDLKLFRLKEFQDKANNFDMCNAKFNSSMFLARLVVGKELHHALTDCVSEIRSISSKILNEEIAYSMRSELDSSSRNLVEFNSETLMQKIMPAILLARKSLEIEITE